MSTLIELVEAEWKDLKGDLVRDTYEVYFGDWVKVTSDSANAYWHTYEAWESSPRLSVYEPEDRASIQVLSNGRYVGHWHTTKDFYDFLRNYMRANVTAVVIVD